MYGADVIDRMVLPNRLISEEAQETCNKGLKKYRKNDSHKCSQVKTNE